MLGRSSYTPIEDYAALGDGRTVALVSRAGSVDFMSLPELHSPTAFGALLDAELGGRFVLAPAGRFEATRRYVGRTNVLETTYRTSGGKARVTEALTLQDGGLLPWVELARRIECLEGEIELEWCVEPRFDWGREPASVLRRGAIAVAEGDGMQIAVHSWDAGEPELEEHFLRGACRLAAGERALLAITCTHAEPVPRPTRDHVEARLDAAVRVWERWLGMWAYDGPWPEAVARSALALKLLVFAPQGSIAAAPTTSLPEKIGGTKNYDYRYAWVRDSAFTLDALLRLGLPEQVHDSFTWLLRAVRETAPDLRPFYSLVGGVPQRCEFLEHLEGYRGSSPVRDGNAAETQLQLGSWGDLLETADLYVSDGNALDPSTAELLEGCVDRVAVIWRDEDSGIWELQDPHHYTSSKLAVWMALDRALRLVESGQLSDAHKPFWREQRDEVHRWIEQNCWSDELGAYTRWAGDDGVDASVLRGARMGYPERERLERSIGPIRESLGAGGPLLWRETGHVGTEGAFVACSFWLVETLARLGRVDEAAALMEELLPYGNDLGLFSEQIDPKSGAFLGNFPQGLSHLSLVAAAGAIEDASATRERAGGPESARAGRG